MITAVPEGYTDDSTSPAESPISEEPITQPRPRPRITRAAVDVSQEYATGMGLSVKPTEVSVRKPTYSEWNRVRDGEEWTATLALVEVNLENRTETYLIWGEHAPALKSILARYIRYYQVFVCINREGNVFLWLCKLPAIRFDTRGESWTKSRLEAAAILKHSWGQVYIPDRGGRYEVETTSSTEEPKWPDLTFDDLLDLAFSERLITALDDPIVLKLRARD